VISIVYFLIFPMIRIENIPLDGADLSFVPKEILENGAQKTANHLLELFESPESEPLYRSKIMALGFENSRATLVLDSLIPSEGELYIYEGLLFKSYVSRYLALLGTKLSMYPSKEAFREDPSKPLETYELGPSWTVEGSVVEERFKISLTQKEPAKTLELYSTDHQLSSLWLSRLGRACTLAPTTGMKFQQFQVEHPLVLDALSGKGTLEIQAWDFASHLDYFTNRIFISNRTLYLVCFSLEEDAEGMGALDFWFRSLACHPTIFCQEQKPSDVTVMVVGTYTEKPGSEKEERKEKVTKLASQFGLNVDLDYHEVNPTDLESLSPLNEGVYKSILSHSYMGEKVRKSTMFLGEYLRSRQREMEKSNFVPVLSVEEVSNSFLLDKELLISTLQLLSLWGDCFHFSHPEELASAVFLGVTFLTTATLADLFPLNMEESEENGIVRHSDLPSVWSGLKKQNEFEWLAQLLIKLLEKFDLCFPIMEEGDKPFMERRSLVPFLLPDEPPEEVFKAWPARPEEGVTDTLRVLDFNVVPEEMVSLSISRLPTSQKKIVAWKNGFLLKDEEGNLALVKMRIKKIAQMEEGAGASTKERKSPFDRFLSLFTQLGSNKTKPEEEGAKEGEEEEEEDIQVENQMTVEVRGREKEQRKKLMKFLVEQLQSAAGCYPGVYVKQKVICPLSPQELRNGDALIPPNHLVGWEEMMEEAGKDKSEGDKVLLCPLSGKPLPVSDLLFYSASD